MGAQRDYDEAKGAARGWQAAADYCLNWAVQDFKDGKDDAAKKIREVATALAKNAIVARDKADKIKTNSTEPIEERFNFD